MGQIPKILWIFYIFLISTTYGDPKAEFTIQSPRVTTYGIWGGPDRCPPDTFTSGFRLRSEPAQGAYDDDSALNAIELVCTSSEGNQIAQISSLQGGLGTWGPVISCPSNKLITGFQLRSEAEQGPFDNTAANNLRIRCGQSDSDYEWIEGDGKTSWGDWTAEQYCPRGMAICGIRTQVQVYDHQSKIFSKILIST